MGTETNSSNDEEKKEDAKEEDPNNPDTQPKDGQAPPLPPPPKCNLNSYYGHRIGFYQTLSLILNAGLMVYAHVGLSAVILSSRDPSASSKSVNFVGGENDSANGTAGIGNGTAVEGKCNEQDVELWIANGGQATRPTHSNFCSREYDGRGCLIDSACIEKCFQETYGYSADCSTCFGTIPSCSISTGCIGVCAADSLGPECQECNGPCVVEFNKCTGFPEIDHATSLSEKQLIMKLTRTRRYPPMVPRATCVTTTTWKPSTNGTMSTTSHSSEV